MTAKRNSTEISINKFLSILTTQIFITAIMLWSTAAHAQYNPPPAPGPYYFVSDTLSTSNQFYWRVVQSFGGIPTIENLNLLATVLGDDPSSLLQSGQRLVAPESFSFSGGIVSLQPFAFTTAGNTKKFNLPLGTNLKSFLNHPLGEAKFDLTLPFAEANVALSDSSAIIRSGTSDGVWHTAADFDVNGNTGKGFDVIAPADGIVEGTTETSSSLAIRHTASNGKQFLTIYQHLVPESKIGLTRNAPVHRGQILGHVQAVGYTHLHFGVAVEGPSKTINGVVVPALWYLIDPFGVDDYRRNSASSTNYNYLPDNTLLPAARGIIHAYVWRTNPPIGSLLLPEDCLRFNPHNLAIKANGARQTIVDGSHFVFSFANLSEANTALNTIKQYEINKSCFIGRPDPSFQYLLVDNRSPAGPASGEDCIGFNRDIITLKALSGGRYQMVSGNHDMFVFPNMLEAGNALSIIMKYGFTRSCFVGRPNASLQYMRAEGGATASRPVAFR